MNAGEPGWGIVKMTPNGMYTEFYPNNELNEEHSGVFDNTTTIYQDMKINMIILVPFANSYSLFRFDETKNAYVVENITSLW